MDHSIGIIPVHTRENGEIFFCLVHHMAGHWAFPKGHANNDESEKETAIRELAEETGITDAVVTDRTFGEHYIYERDGEQVEKSVKYFLGSVAVMELMAKMPTQEIVDRVWLPYEEAKERITFPETRALCDEVVRYLEKTQRTQ